MARPMSDGVGYFPKDTGFYHDDKVKLLRAEFGAKGLYLLDYILCELYGKDGYFMKWDRNKCYLVSDGAGCGCSPSFADELIAGCIRCEIFDKSVFEAYGVITSAGIQRRYIRMFKGRDYIRIYKEYFLLNVNDKKDVPEGVLSKCAFISVNGTENPVKSTENPVKSTENPTKEIKEKEIKEKEFSFIHSNAREDEDDEEKYINQKIADADFDEEDEASTEAYREELKSNLKQKFIMGELGQGVVFMSNEQFLNLADILSPDELEKYFAVIVKCEKSGKKFTRKSHYQAIIDMAKKDRKIKNTSQKMENGDIVNSLKDMYGAHDV